MEDRKLLDRRILAAELCSHGRKSRLADRAKPLLRRLADRAEPLLRRRRRLTHSLLSSVKRLRRLKRLKRLNGRTWGNQSRAATRRRRRDPQHLRGISESSHSQCLRVRHDAKKSPINENSRKSVSMN
jgi:hypothetical protein